MKTTLRPWPGSCCTSRGTSRARRTGRTCLRSGGSQSPGSASTSDSSERNVPLASPSPESHPPPLHSSWLPPSSSSSSPCHQTSCRYSPAVPWQAIQFRRTSSDVLSVLNSISCERLERNHQYRCHYSRTNERNYRLPPVCCLLCWTITDL